MGNAHVEPATASGQPMAKICELSEVSLVVTDASADPLILADLAAVACDVQVAEPAR